MKKYLKLLPVIFILCLLSGCYASDSTMRINYDGTVDYDSTLLATEAMYQNLARSTTNDFIDTQIEDFKSEFESGSEDMKDFSIEPLYPNGKPENQSSSDNTDENANNGDTNQPDQSAENPATENPEGENSEAQTPNKEYDNTNMNGLKIHAKFNSVDSFLSSQLRSYTMPSIMLRKYSDKNQASKSAIDIETKTTFFGTRYTGSGSIDINGDYENYLSYMPDYLKAGTNNASNSITVKLPLSFVKSNASSKGLLGNNMTWKVTGEENKQTTAVSFTAFVINPIILLETLIIIVLAILLIIFAGKKKNNGTDEEAAEPDEYYTDEEGNQIPVYYDNEEDSEEAESESIEDLQDAPAETEDSENNDDDNN